jgi:hypothetical protein
VQVYNACLSPSLYARIAHKHASHRHLCGVAPHGAVLHLARPGRSSPGSTGASNEPASKLWTCCSLYPEAYAAGYINPILVVACVKGLSVQVRVLAKPTFDAADLELQPAKRTCRLGRFDARAKNTQ